MTQDEAKKRWCPFARVVLYSSNEGSGAPSAGNRCVMTSDLDAALNGATKCIGSACMAWRWQYFFMSLPEENRPHDWKTFAAAEEGYCGLAGKP